MNLVQVWRWNRANKPDYKQDNRWQNHERSHDQKHDANSFNELNGAVPKLNKCVHKRKYVTHAVTRQIFRLLLTTFNPHISGVTSK